MSKELKETTENAERIRKNEVLRYRISVKVYKL